MMTDIRNKFSLRKNKKKKTVTIDENNNQSYTLLSDHQSVVVNGSGQTKNKNQKTSSSTVIVADAHMVQMKRDQRDMDLAVLGQQGNLDDRTNQEVRLRLVGNFRLRSFLCFCTLETSSSFVCAILMITSKASKTFMLQARRVAFARTWTFKLFRVSRLEHQNSVSLLSDAGFPLSFLLILLLLGTHAKHFKCFAWWLCVCKDDIPHPIHPDQTSLTSISYWTTNSWWMPLMPDLFDVVAGSESDLQFSGST